MTLSASSTAVLDDPPHQIGMYWLMRAFWSCATGELELGNDVGEGG